MIISKHAKAKNKVIEKFGCLSIHPGIIQGTWTDKISNVRYFDNCFKFEICVDNRDDNIEFFDKFKDYLIQEFKQHEIYMIFTEVNMV